MKKVFKALTVVLLAVVAACACAFAVSACNSSSDYNFTVEYADGSAVKGTDGNAFKVDDKNVVCVQICHDDYGCVEYTMTFKKGVTVDKNGKISFSQKDIDEMFQWATSNNSLADITKFDFHVWNVKDDTHNYKVAVNGKGNYTLKLVDANIYS